MSWTDLNKKELNLNRLFKTLNVRSAPGYMPGYNTALYHLIKHLLNQMTFTGYGRQ